jgi:hypothetical protein
MISSPFKSAVLWLAATLVVAFSYQKMGWPGVALSVGALIFWMLLNATRMLQTLKRAANNPKGFVASAVMLHARLQPGLSLLQVIAMTKALGEEVSKEPEVWRWTDDGHSFVECRFEKGKLAEFTLTRSQALPGEDSPA